MPRVRVSKRREDFIQAAVEVVAEHGVEGATTRRIAAAADAPLASLHYCFESKEELFFAVYEQQMLTLDKTYHVRQQGGLGRAASALLRQLMEYFTSSGAYTHAQAELFFWALRQDGRLGAKTYEGHLGSVVKSLRDGMREGDPDNLVEPLARMLVSVADGLSFQWLADRNEDRLMTDVDVACEAMERLVDGNRP